MFHVLRNLVDTATLLCRDDTAFSGGQCVASHDLVLSSSPVEELKVP